MVTLDLLLVGFGNVGRRFVRLLDERAFRLRHDLRFTPRVIAIITRRHGSAFSRDGIDTERALQAVECGSRLDSLSASPPLAEAAESVAFIEHICREAPGHLVLVETTPLDIERGEPAITHVRAALSAGAHVITANKGPAAFACRELSALATAAGRAFLFEGAVLDGVPVFNLARETLPGVEIVGFRGIVNSTTNYILSAMEEGRSFEEALAEMQAEGIAEADASLDLDGWDAAAKAAVLSNALMGATITPRLVARTGIRDISRGDVEGAMRRGRRMRLVATGARVGNEVSARVAPQELEEDEPLARLRGTQNALVLRTDLLGEIALTELTAGLTQTAYALMSDLVTVRRKFF